MAACSACNTTILFGGVREGEQRFCNDECRYKGYLLTVAREIPSGTLDQQIRSVYHGTCPRCQGPGPVDVHISYRVWSALLMTSWRNQPRMSCRSCGTKAQLGDMTFSLLLGWWGFPWGLIMTPVQVVRNIIALFSRRHAEAPSAELGRLVSMDMAARIIERRMATATAPAAPMRG